MKILLFILTITLVQGDNEQEMIPEPEDVVVHIQHHMPYYQGGHGPTRTTLPLMLPPPQQHFLIKDMLSPEQKTVELKKSKKIVQSNTYPQHMVSPFNLFDYFHVYNPNMSQITGSSPLHSMGMGNHPFSSPGMIATQMNPYQYLNPAMIGMQSAAQTTGSGIPGFGPFNLLNQGDFQAHTDTSFNNQENQQPEQNGNRKLIDNFMQNLDSNSFKESFSKNDGKLQFERNLKEMENINKELKDQVFGKERKLLQIDNSKKDEKLQVDDIEDFHKILLDKVGI